MYIHTVLYMKMIEICYLPPSSRIRKKPLIPTRYPRIRNHEVIKDQAKQRSRLYLLPLTILVEWLVYGGLR